MWQAILGWFLKWLLETVKEKAEEYFAKRKRKKLRKKSVKLLVDEILKPSTDKPRTKEDAQRIANELADLID